MPLCFPRRHPACYYCKLKPIKLTLAKEKNLLKTWLSDTQIMNNFRGLEVKCKRYAVRNERKQGGRNGMVIMGYLFGGQTSCVRYTLIVLLASVLLTGCSGTNFRKEGFLEIGEQMATYNCRKTINPRDYEACVSRVRENYDDTYKSSDLERR